MAPTASESGSGRVLVLQGSSSAGKRTLATVLQKELDEYWWAVEADDITAMQPVSGRTGWWDPSKDERPHPSWFRRSDWNAGFRAIFRPSRPSPRPEATSLP